ncbi:MAG: hypothetical protein U0Y82_05315 [Thermoleophilia bacterium]
MGRFRVGVRLMAAFTVVVVLFLVALFVGWTGVGGIASGSHTTSRTSQAAYAASAAVYNMRISQAQAPTTNEGYQRGQRQQRGWPTPAWNSCCIEHGREQGATPGGQRAERRVGRSGGRHVRAGVGHHRGAGRLRLMSRNSATLLELVGHFTVDAGQ